MLCLFAAWTVKLVKSCMISTLLGSRTRPRNKLGEVVLVMSLIVAEYSEEAADGVINGNEGLV